MKLESAVANFKLCFNYKKTDVAEHEQTDVLFTKAQIDSQNKKGLQATIVEVSPLLQDRLKNHKIDSASLFDK